MNSAHSSRETLLEKLERTPQNAILSRVSVDGKSAGRSVGKSVYYEARNM